MKDDDFDVEGPEPVRTLCLDLREAVGEMFPACCAEPFNHAGPHRSQLYQGAYISGTFEPYEWSNEVVAA